MTRSSCSRQLSALALCLLLVPTGFAQQTAPQNQTAPPPPPPANLPQSNPVAPTPATVPPQETRTLAQQAQQEQQLSISAPTPFRVQIPRSHNPLSPYRPSTAPPLDLHNSPRLEDLIRDGKLYITLQDAISLAIENNLDLAYFRYNFPIAQTDILRTKSGAPANGVNAGIVQNTQGGIGGTTATGGGGGGGASAAAGAGGLVQSTLGQGAAIPSFDPFLTFKGYDDHTVTQEANEFLVGTPTLRVNTIQGLANYSQSFHLGTNISAQYLGQRITSNSPYNGINPELYSNFGIQISQPLLAGFGRSSNERFIRIAKRNAQITDLAFKAQVIATITQVENIYWDLVSAYQDEQIKSSALGFANQTLSDDQKQLQLKAIPALQVLTDQSLVATAEGNLTVARATLRLNELLMKNAVTKVDDPVIDAMPVIPLDLKGPPDPNADKPMDDLIAAAEKNRPDVAIDEASMQVAQENLKGINSELLPSLNMYGLYAGAGIAGPPNPYCTLGAECASDLPSGFPGEFQNIFNYSSPEYQVGLTLQINLRNRQAKADQFRTVLEYRQKQIAYVQQQKTIRLDVRNSLYALEQQQAGVEAAQKARDLAEQTFNITKQEQQLGAKSSVDPLNAENLLAVAESALDAAQAKFEEAKVGLDRATGTTLDRTHVSVDDARSGVVTHGP
ncbi:MAG: TolC family protein [Acidobacteriaceae bacterium]